MFASRSTILLVLRYIVVRYMILCRFLREAVFFLFIFSLVSCLCSVVLCLPPGDNSVCGWERVLYTYTQVGWSGKYFLNRRTSLSQAPPAPATYCYTFWSRYSLASRIASDLESIKTVWLGKIKLFQQLIQKHYENHTKDLSCFFRRCDTQRGAPANVRNQASAESTRVSTD